jgi:hypothetical protein
MRLVMLCLICWCVLAVASLAAGSPSPERDQPPIAPAGKHLPG